MGPVILIIDSPEFEGLADVLDEIEEPVL